MYVIVLAYYNPDLGICWFIAAQVNPRVALCPMQTENVSIDVNVIEYPITEPFHDMVLPRQMV